LAVSVQQLVSNIALPQAQHKATSPTRKPLDEMAIDASKQAFIKFIIFVSCN
jgi:hypothetical protein